MPPRTAESVNEFAFDFYRNLSETEGNVFFSPVGTHTVFSIVYEGAGGSTSSRMIDLFGFEPDDEERRAASARMMAALNAQDPRAVLEMANALWMSDWFESYLDVVRRAYLVEAETYPIEADEFYFGEPKPVWREIDYWASERAGGKIAPTSIAVVQCGKLLAIVANVVNFEGAWTIQFPKEDTRKGQFWRGEGDSVHAYFMHAKGGFDYANAEDAQVLRLPYEGGRLSMLVVLPYEAGGLERLAERSGARMGEWLGMLESRNISVSLPKFQIATYHGVHLDAGARTEDAKFRVSTHPGVWSYIVEHKSGDGSVFPHLNGFNEGGCYLDGAGHSAYLTVNENGTETSEDAAAMTITESEPPPPLHFNANRPFLFAIYDEQSGLILFMGRMSDPSA